ncbi:MAG: hypothetical protein L6427_12495 [Actinomycetia bacterium]|nr:hypothetical protein [Actinomycetota bacterium]MCG2796653.1 hypothetical protein [Actinomycetes bacterium]
MAGKKHSLMRCRECGLPRFVSFFMKWNRDGTITQFMRRDFRVVILHFGLIDSLFANIESRLGLSIEHIAFEAQRNASKATMEAFYDRMPGLKFATRIGFVRRIGVSQFNKVGAVTGQCVSETVEYVPGKYGIARIRNPFHLNMMAANVLGAFESLEGAPFTHTWEEEARDTYLIRIERAEEKPEIARRMTIEYSPIIPGDLKLERCPRCHAPRALSHLRWMENKGIILDTRTGTRVVMLDGYMVAAVFREMARELGDEVNELLVDAQREWTVDHVDQLGYLAGNGSLSPEERKEAYGKYLDMLPIYGQGNPVAFEMGDSTIDVTIENPYEKYILAGNLQGLYEALERSRGRVTWEEPKPGVISFTVRPT